MKVQIPGTPSIQVAEEGLSALGEEVVGKGWKSGAFFLKTAPSSLGGPFNLVGAAYLPHGFKWPPKGQGLSFPEHPPSATTFTYIMSHPHSNLASRCHSPHFVKEEYKFREEK